MKFDSDNLGLPGALDGDIEDGVAVVRDLSVDVGSQNQGLGRRLVEAFETWARESGATSIEGASMMGAVGFWERLGYEVGNIDEDGYAPIRKALPAPRLAP